MKKKFLSFVIAMMLVLSCACPAFAAGPKATVKADKVETFQAVKAEKDDPNKEVDYSDAVAAAEAVALEAAGVARNETKFVDSHVQYSLGQAYAVRVEIGVYTKGAGTARSVYLIDIETLEIL